MATNDKKFLIKNGLAVGASGIPVINTAGEWVGNSGPGESPYGATGVQGIHGASGITGDQGATGSEGATGIDGYQGATGVEGYQGATGSQGTAGATGAIKLQHTYEWTDDQLVWNGNAYAGGVSPSVSRLEFLQTDGIYTYLNALASGTTLVIDWQASGLSVATVTTIGTVQAPTAYTNGRHYLQISANPDGYASGGYASGDPTDVLMIGAGPRNQGFRGITGATGVQGATGEIGTTGDQGTDGATGATGVAGIDGASGAAGIDGASGVTGEIGATGVHGHRYHTSSTTTLNLTTGATGVVVVDDYLNYSAGQTILLADGGGKHIHATVTSWDANTKILAFTPIDHVGTGSASVWEINLDGAEGQVGASGVTGQDGATGATGADGFQGITGDLGATGADGEQGYQGASGADGVQGATGAAGIDGASGAQGIDGASGADGVQGATGSQGSQGDEGDIGYQGIDGATGVTGATGAQGGDGSGYSVTETDSVADGDWGTIWYTGSTTTGDGSARLSFNIADPVYIHLAALSVGQSIVIDFPNATVVSGLSQTSPQTVTVTEAITVDGSFNTHKIKVSAEPSNSAATQLVSTNPPDAIFYLLYTSPTNTGYMGSTGADGVQGAEGNTGYNADQLTTGTPRGTYDQNTVYDLNDIVYYAYDGKSYRCILGGLNNYFPSEETAVWRETAFVGASGASGINGSTGPVGVDGASGAAGIDGASGASGIDGASGAAGIDGASGAAGIDGASGAAGIDGASGPVGIDGASGITGATGYSGLQFKATADGNFSVYAIGTPITIPFLADPDTGATTYNYSTGQSVIIAKDINNYMVADITNVYGGGNTIDVEVTMSVGTASGVSGWIVNLNGAVGWIGASGATGTQGASGASGPRGTTGDIGQVGYDGASGASGVQGSTGAQGIDGASGPDGDMGATGADGDRGTTGDVGDQGVTGQDGATGFTGLKGYGFITGTTGLTGTSQQVVDRFQANDQGTVKYIVQGVDPSTNVQATEVILTQNADGVYMTEYATLRTGATGLNVMSVTATTDGSVVSLKVTPRVTGTNVTWHREGVQSRIGGTTVYDPSGTYLFSSRTHSDSGSIPVGMAYVYPSDYWYDIIDFATLASTNANITFDSAGIGPQNPALGYVDSWDGAVLTVIITSGNFTSRDDLNKITYGY